MILVTVGVADERMTPARPHIHRRFWDREEADDYIDELKIRLGRNIPIEIREIDLPLVRCKVCGIQV